MYGKLCLCKNSPRFYQIASNKRWGSMPLDPLVCHMLCTQICACPPNNPYNLILPPTLGKKLKETLHLFVYQTLWNTTCSQSV